MTKVLLTGGSGFIAAHILAQLLEQGHSVVTTVRNQEKAARIHEAHADVGKDRLQTVIVPDIAQESAFDEVVQTPGIEVVLHTASPFHFRVTDPKKDLIDPAVVGTTGILKAIVKHAPQVRRVVVTSSFAAIFDSTGLFDPQRVFSEKSWNPVTLEEGVKGDPSTGYRASKKLAEEAAWEFVKNEKPKFDLVTVNPPLVFGPVVHHLEGLASINTSNARIADAVTGVWKAEGKIPETGVFNWVDVRDVAKAHILAGLEKPAAGGHRLWTTAGFFSNRDVYEILVKNFPEYKDRLPSSDAPGGLAPKEHYQYNNDETKKLLGIDWIQLEKSIVDTVNSIKVHVN